mmetsp:Transcript_12611/g.18540  ORF Transcript_12611/g.18540 Transcript_12611/m.18540 type:complete len:165 (+) Transcript_12611:133-627(+)
MANAAAKKAAAAKLQTSKTYLPIFIAINALFLIGKFVIGSVQSYTIWSYVGIALLVGLNVMCYLSILEAASSASPTSTDLVGGIWLDVVALVWSVQAGTLFWNSFFYYFLLILPPWAAFKIYTTVRGGTRAAPNNNEPQKNDEVSEELNKRRQKRSERRRQKRM